MRLWKPLCVLQVFFQAVFMMHVPLLWPDTSCPGLRPGSPPPPGPHTWHCRGAYSATLSCNVDDFFWGVGRASICWSIDKVIDIVMQTNSWLLILCQQVRVSFERLRALRPWRCCSVCKLFSPLPLISQGASSRLGKHVKLFLLLCKTGSQHKHFSKVSCNVWHCDVWTSAVKCDGEIRLKIFELNNYPNHHYIVHIL